VNKYLLDTNVISELRKTKPHGGVLSWINSLQDGQIFISALSLGELQSGIELTRRQDFQKAQEIEIWVDQLAQSHQIIPMDALCFREWARLLNAKPQQLAQDAMIAATARVHTLIVATRNERDFQIFGVDILNPFKIKF